MSCKVPPPGWLCTREEGHEGPCAAISEKPATNIHLSQAFADGFLAGFDASGEGFNGEYPFGDGKATEEQDLALIATLRASHEAFVKRWKAEHIIAD